MNTLSDYTYRRDMEKRVPSLNNPLNIHFASHLEGHALLSISEPILATLRDGGDMSAHVSPMAQAKDAFRKANKNGDWSRYARLMDLLLNKWGIFHFHADSDRVLVFAYICQRTKSAYIIDLRRHDKDWKAEQHLVGIVVANWPDKEIVREIGEGHSPLTEAELLEARKAGINMAVGVAGKSYLPASRGLMMDGSGYDTLTGISPVVFLAKSTNSDRSADEKAKSPHFMMFGTDPDDPRPSWVIVAEQAAMMAKQRHRDSARYLAEAGHGIVADAVCTTLKKEHDT